MRIYGVGAGLDEDVTKVAENAVAQLKGSSNVVDWDGHKLLVDTNQSQVHLLSTCGSEGASCSFLAGVRPPNSRGIKFQAYSNLFCRR